MRIQLLAYAVASITVMYFMHVYNCKLCFDLVSIEQDCIGVVISDLPCTLPTGPRDNK